MSFEKMMSVLKSVQQGDTIEITPSIGKVRTMQAVRSFDHDYNVLEISSGRKGSLRMTRNGSIFDDGDGVIAWQPTMATQIEEVDSIKLVGAQGLKLV
tara:strand:+ start:6497 stop:6790 length:294 start_codon:yes stop_codon:yes gene_type:complete